MGNPPEPPTPPAADPPVPPSADPPTPPAPEPPAPGTDRLSALENAVTGLLNTVTALATTKTSALPDDSKPVKKPWTHRRFI